MIAMTRQRSPWRPARGFCQSAKCVAFSGGHSARVTHNRGVQMAATCIFTTLFLRRNLHGFSFSLLP